MRRTPSQSTAIEEPKKFSKFFSNPNLSLKATLICAWRVIALFAQKIAPGCKTSEETA